MVLGSHFIITTYGFWLPNDPRGSWSDFVGAWELFRFGPATKTTERRSLAHRPHDRDQRLAAKTALKYPPVEFNGHQALAVAEGFTQAIQARGYIIPACSILPRHIHGVALRHERDVEDIVGHLKYEATQSLLRAGLHPFADLRGTDGRLPTVWTKRAWKVFLSCEGEVFRAIHYVEQNPLKEGKRAQRWNFTVPFDAPRAPSAHFV